MEDGACCEDLTRATKQSKDDDDERKRRVYWGNTRMTHNVRSRETEIARTRIPLVDETQVNVATSRYRAW